MARILGSGHWLVVGVPRRRNNRTLALPVTMSYYPVNFGENGWHRRELVDRLSVGGLN
jgi:hypothetical protein